MRTLLLGEALVDLVCERAVSSPPEAEAWVAHPGGAPVAIAIAAAAAGAQVELAGATGDDAWGDWLAGLLRERRVGLEHFRRLRRTPTALSLVTAGADGVPHADVRGDAPGLELADDAVDSFDALVLASEVLADETNRPVALSARDQALAAGKPLVVHADLDAPRWGSPAEAASAVREIVRDAYVVVCSAESARLLTGEREPAAAAAGILAGGAQHVLVSLGAGGAMLRGGGMRLDAPAVPVEPVDLSGALEAFTGVVVEHLARTDFYAAALAAALPRAVHAHARTSERWGAVPR